MKSIVKKEFRNVYREEEVKYYLTKDGMEFEDLDSAKQHEAYLKIKKTGINLSFPAEINLYYVNSKNEIKTIFDKIFIDIYEYELNKYTYPCWIGIETIDDSCGPYFNLTNLSEVKDRHEQYLEMYQKMISELEQ